MSLAVAGDRNLHLYRLVCCALCSVVAFTYAGPLLALVISAAHFPTDGILRYVLFMDCLVAVLALSAVRLRSRTSASPQTAPNLIKIQTSIEKLREHRPAGDSGLAFSDGELDSSTSARQASTGFRSSTLRRVRAMESRGVNNWDNGELVRRLESDQLRLRAPVAEGRTVASRPANAATPDAPKPEPRVMPEDGRLLFLALAKGMRKRNQEATVQDLAALIKYVGQSGQELLNTVRAAQAGAVAVCWDGRDWLVDHDNQDSQAHRSDER